MTPSNIEAEKYPIGFLVSNGNLVVSNKKTDNDWAIYETQKWIGDSLSSGRLNE